MNKGKCSKCGEYKECKWFDGDETFKTESGRIGVKQESICNECLNMEPILISLSYDQYRPGMRLYLHKDYESLKTEAVVEIATVNGYDMESSTYKRQSIKDELFFVTTDNLKIVWNGVPVSCYLERNETTTYLDSMYDHYLNEAEKRMLDPDYMWNKRDHENYLIDKHEVVTELLLEYEYRRILGQVSE